jgi:hypothetical protein
MSDPTLFSDPSIYAITLNLISTGIAAGISKARKKAFRPQDITGFLNLLSFREIIEQELDFENISDADIKGLEIFIKTDIISDVISQIYIDSDKSNIEIENEFVQIFCETKPIGVRSSEAFARKLFLCIKLASDNLLRYKIMQGDLLAHDYKEEERHKEVVDYLKQIEKKVEVQGFNQTSQGTISSSVPKEYIDDELKDSVNLINNKQYENAKTRIFEVIGILKNKPQENKKLLSKAYHLLAVVYNKNKENGGNFDIAEHYARMSLDSDPLNDKANVSLASIYINKHGKENFETAFGIVSSLWEKSDQNDPQILEVYLWGMYFTKSAADAITFFESSPHAESLTEHNDILSNVIARFYITINNPRKSLQFIKNSIKLDPDNPDHYAIKAAAYREISLAEDYLFSDFEICPKFKNYDCIEKSLKCNQKALSLCKDTTDSVLKERTKKEIYTCSLFLNRSTEKVFQRIRLNINLSLLPENEQKTLEFFDFIHEFNQRHFSAAYEKLINLRDWNDFHYATKINIGLIFLKRGSPEESRKIFKTLESEAEIKKDFRFRGDFSLVEAILDNKTGLLQQIEKIKCESTGSQNEKSAFDHSYAMINRYRESGKEIDRMLTHLQEHDKKFPNEKLLKAFPFNEKEGKAPQELVDVLKNAMERDQKTKKIFTDHQVPSYIIADTHHFSYPELMNRLKDPNFHLRYYPPDKSSQEELRENFFASELFIFDYSSLLNLAKMDLLWELEKIPGKLSISTSLFEKIQTDLVYYENLDLRKLWNFIRFSSNISIVEIDADPKKYEEMSKYFEKWILDTIELISIREKSVLVTDDYNFIRLIKSQKSKGTTSLIFLNYLLDNNYIDPKIYGISIGILADQMYIILPYDGEDLFQIAMDDDCKIKLRSYHLINHITLPEVSPSTYTQQFGYFIDKLWRSGALFEDKVSWLVLITERMVFAINQRREMHQIVEVSMLIFDFKQIWEKLLPLCKLSDLTVLQVKCNTLFEKDLSKTIEKYVLSRIAKQKTILSVEDLN